MDKFLENLADGLNWIYKKIMSVVGPIYGKYEPTIKKHRKEIIVCCIAIVYLIGILATGVDRRDPGFTVNPFEVIRCLFSEAGKAVLYMLIFVPICIYLILMLKKIEFGGATPDEKRNFLFAKDDTYGTAELMDYDRMKKFLHCVSAETPEKAEGDIIGVKNGMVLSRPKDSMHNRHCAVIGASGSMKSRAIVRNKILGCARRGESMVLTDPKGELCRDTAVWLRKKGYIVRVLNLVSPSHSNGWNFLYDSLREYAEMEKAAYQATRKYDTTCVEVSEIIDTIAHVIIANTGGAKSDAFWDNAERGLLKAAMFYQYYQYILGKDGLDFEKAYYLILENDEKALSAKMNALKTQIPKNEACTSFSAFVISEKNHPMIQQGLLFRIEVCKTEPIARLLRSDQIDLELPARERCAYFLITPDQHSTYDFISCLFFSLLFIRVVKYADTKTTTGRCPVPVNLLLDEFPNIGQIPDFEKKIATVRSRDVNICILFQSIPDLIARYPAPNHFRILNNCDYTIFLGGGDPDTAKYFSNRSGEATVVSSSKTESHNKLEPIHFTLEQRESSGVGKRMVLTVNEIQTMAKDNPLAELIVIRDQPILECEKFDYTKDPESAKWEPMMLSEFDPTKDFWKVKKDKPLQEASKSQKSEDSPSEEKDGQNQDDRDDETAEAAAVQEEPAAETDDCSTGPTEKEPAPSDEDGKSSFDSGVIERTRTIPCASKKEDSGEKKNAPRQSTEIKSKSAPKRGIRSIAAGAAKTQVEGQMDFTEMGGSRPTKDSGSTSLPSAPKKPKPESSVSL